jgi:hypothetical protein
MSTSPIVAPMPMQTLESCLADGQLHCPTLVVPPRGSNSGAATFVTTPCRSPPATPSFLTQSVKKQPRSEFCAAFLALAGRLDKLVDVVGGPGFEL